MEVGDAGLRDKVNQHYLSTFGSAAAVGLISGLAQLLGTAGLTAEDAAGTLSEVLSGTIPGRASPREVTVYTPVGLPWQDLVLAWTAYHQAQAASIGTEFDFLA